MKKLVLILILGMFAGVLSGCSTIMRDGKQVVSVKSNTDRVNIKIADKFGETIFEGQTPVTTTLKTSAGGYFDPEKYTVTATKEGYASQTVRIDWHVSKWYYLGNLGFGGLIGYLIVDPVSGHMYYLDENVYVNMTPLASKS
ncbi:MAG: hypothetical protein PHE89_03995 [Alphaproteobacteria bacterium]|nr:hypothetical protein [Alphaproteobacteria bacterium]